MPKYRRHDLELIAQVPVSRAAIEAIVSDPVARNELLTLVRARQENTSSFSVDEIDPLDGPPIDVSFADLARFIAGEELSDPALVPAARRAQQHYLPELAPSAKAQPASHVVSPGESSRNQD